ncbi:MAG: hypothetical protein SGJ20_07335 [Planctomycetota bacterium]|nr:hypothetical protein [Planctomycetota bacterium]
MLDSRLVESVEGLRIRLGRIEKDPRNPLFGADQPWEVRMDNLYPTVIFDWSAGQYHCWYSPFIVDPATTGTPLGKREERKYIDVLNQANLDKREMALCYAISADGLQWKKPTLGIYDFAGSTQNNIVLRLPTPGPHGAGVVRDDHDVVLARRFKAFFSFDGGLRLARAVDGVRWDPPTECQGVQADGDTHNCLFWASNLDKYVGFTRTWDDVRQVARTESIDLKTWSPAVVVLQGMDPEHQTYALQAFPYSGVYLGLLMVLDTRNDTVQCELAWSPDTQHWNRICPGHALIGNGPEGSYDAGCVYASPPIIQERRIQLYYGGSNGRHGDWRDSFLCRAELSLDRWAGYQAETSGPPGRLITRAVAISGDEMRVTADAADGLISISVIDKGGHVLLESEPICADITDGKITWKQPAAFERLVGGTLRLRFELNKATLYSFHFRRATK